MFPLNYVVLNGIELGSAFNWDTVHILQFSVSNNPLSLDVLRLKIFIAFCVQSTAGVYFAINTNATQPVIAVTQFYQLVLKLSLIHI